MRLLYIADARSPIALNWIRYFVDRGNEIHIVSSTPSFPDVLPGLASFHVIPLSLSGLNRQSARQRPASSAVASRRFSLARLRHGVTGPFVMDVRYFVSSFEIYRHVARARDLIREIQPDLVHAMRIPFEGILAALAAESTPLLLSVWGNDLTLFAQRYRTIGSLTRKALARTDALHCDCRRDLALAPRWGFDSSKPSRVLPGAGGVQASIFNPSSSDVLTAQQLKIPTDAEVVINPRGFRGYVRNDTFFRSIPLIVAKRPNVIFLCSAMAGNPVAERWVDRLNIRSSVRLLPIVERDQMAEYFRLSQVTVSLSEHDGTPNTLLEAMACGCFPIAGDIETVREWISEAVNGFLCDSNNPSSVARAILRALESPQIRTKARERNLRLISERADYNHSMESAERFYAEVVRGRAGLSQ